MKSSHEYIVFLEKRAEENLKKLPPKIKEKIIAEILKLKKNPKPTRTRKIIGSENYYRIRVGSYRIVYKIENKERQIKIFRIRHRKEVYRNLF